MGSVPLDSPILSTLAALVGEEGLVTHPDRLVVYECDAYTLEKRPPQAVVLPRTTEEVRKVVSLAAAHRIPIIPRGAGTSLSGTVLAVDGGIMMALTRMNRIVSVDGPNRRALVEAGCVNAWISREVQPLGLQYAPDPSSQTACTIGGNVATNSGGPHTLSNGVTTNHVLGLEIVLPDGETVWLGSRPDQGDDPEGLDLRGVTIGSEGMFGIVTQVLVRLIPLPQACRTLLGIFGSVQQASQTVSDIVGAGIVPAALEMMDQLITQAVEQAYGFGFPTDAGAVLIVELDGLEVDIDHRAERIVEICEANGAREVRVARAASERAAIWKSRKRAFGAIGRLSPNYLTEDGVVPRSKLPRMMDFIAAIGEKHGVRIANVFHAGDGNLHPLVLYDERVPGQVGHALQAGHEILEECVRLGGSVTGEHGIGVQKIDFMRRQFSPSDLEAMRALRQAFDPAGLCNPHKMFPGGKRCIDFAPRRQAPA